MTREQSTSASEPNRPEGSSAGDFAVDVPDDAPVHECGYCGRPFETADYLALHRGLAHGNDVDEDERAEFRDASEVEAAAVRRFRLKAIGVVVLVYFVLLMVYALV